MGNRTRAYRVREGFSLRLTERDIRQGGQVVELDDDQAKEHGHRIEPAAKDEAVKKDGQRAAA